MKKLLITLLTLICISNIYSQDVSITNVDNEPTVHDIQKNSLYVGSHLYTIDAFYERAFPLFDKLGIIAGGGIIQDITNTSSLNPAIKLGCIIGGYKHFLEAGVAIAPIINNINLFSPMIGYRFQHSKGFLFRFDIMIVTDSGTYKDGSGDWTESYPFPGLSFGYSF